MARLEEVTRGASVKGILSDALVTIVDVKWHGSNVAEVTCKDAQGRPGNELLYRDREPTLELAAAGRPWSFEADGALFRLVSEANRIRLAYLFDPLLAIHTSLVDPLPHQITGVYGEMLGRQPLRFLLADDPGAGKTIMAGLLIKELMARGDLRRCLIVCPGMLAEQWQDELSMKFHLPFELMTNDKLEAARTGNWFQENSLVICRLDKLSRDEDVQTKLAATDWDLIVCDEAHKMSASFFGGEVKETKRYKLGRLLSALTRHFLLMTATPHNGKEEDFQLFMALLDGDRFEGRFRDGVHLVDASDLMRRLVKEQLLKFDGTPLFPERRAYTVSYELSSLEAQLYKEVTDYVTEEFNRADALENEGRKGTIGFALTILQRRLASSPEAIYQSLKRRRERLEKRLAEEKLAKRGEDAATAGPPKLPVLSMENLDDLDDAPDAEIEQTEEAVVDQATAAQTIGELPLAVSRLRRGNIAPVDLAQAAIGPGMAVFSSYSKILEADGSTMSVRSALGLINQVLDEVLTEQEGEFDSDTGWAIAWYEQYALEEGPFGVAETLSKAKDTSVRGLEDSGILISKAGKVRLLGRQELDGDWNPRTDRRLTLWEVAQHLVRRHETGGEAAASELLREVGGGMGEAAKDLAYRLYQICDRKGWSSEAQPYNALVVAWPEISRLASAGPAPAPVGELFE